MPNLRQLQIEFLESVALLETRTEHNGEPCRKVDVDDEYLSQCIQQIDTKITAILKARLKAAENAQKDTLLQKAILQRSRTLQPDQGDKQIGDNIVWWIDNWCWTLSPHITKYEMPFKIPFVLFPKQVEYIRWREQLYRKNQSGVVFKCRDVGVSWLNVAHQAFHFIFEPGYQGRIGSLKAEEVDDKNDPDSLFQKLRTIIYSLPKWMLPPLLVDQNNKYDTKMKIFNPSNNATISGQQGDNMGRGGRASLYDIDEWAKVEHDRLVESNLASNTPCRIYTGTPIGRDNDYAQKVASGALPVFSFDYWDDPRKSDDWLENYKAGKDEAVVAQEVFKSFDAFVGGTALPSEWVDCAVRLFQLIQKGEYQYNAPAEGTAGMDVASGGRHRTVILERKGAMIGDVEEWNISNTTDIARRAGAWCEQRNNSTLNFDPISCGTGVKSTYEKEKQNYNVLFVPVDYRSTPSDMPLQGDTKPAYERCANRRAELMMIARKKLENTYEFIMRGIPHDIEDMVALPDNQKLRQDLSTPERLMMKSKWRLESKEDMVKRGVGSPDYFDAFLLSLADEMAHTRVVTKYKQQRSPIARPSARLTAAGGRGAVSYVSIYHGKTLNCAAIHAIWQPQSQQLVVCDEMSVVNTSVSNMVANLNLKFHGQHHEYIGNADMFKKGADDLFSQYLGYGILINENALYNELTAIATINQLFEQNRIQIDPQCEQLQTQLQAFKRTKNTPDKSRMELALALCNLVNRLEEYHELRRDQTFQRHYWKTTPA